MRYVFLQLAASLVRSKSVDFHKRPSGRRLWLTRSVSHAGLIMPDGPGSRPCYRRPNASNVTKHTACSAASTAASVVSEPPKAPLVSSSSASPASSSFNQSDSARLSTSTHPSPFQTADVCSSDSPALRFASIDRSSFGPTTRPAYSAYMHTPDWLTANPLDNISISSLPLRQTSIASPTDPPRGRHQSLTDRWSNSSPLPLLPSDRTGSAKPPLPERGYGSSEVELVER
ncbi:unnamed protein product, partial [Protopolystoma xenopodis]